MEYSPRTQPFYPLIEVALKGKKKWNKATASRNIPLAELRTKEHDAAWEAIVDMLSASVTLAHPNPEWDMCVFTDASESHWGSVITQCVPGTLELPFDEQVHQPLLFLSGAFKSSSLRWPIIDKEAFAIVNTLDRCEYPFSVNEESMCLRTIVT